MNQKEIEQFAERIIKETAVVVKNSTETSNSTLLAGVQANHKELADGISGVHTRLDKLNGSVAKHADKLASQDVLNAQMTITQQQIVVDLATLKKREEETNAFRLKSEGSINTFKWLFGFVGLGTLVTFLKVMGIIGQ